MNTQTVIPVAKPALIGNERAYVLDCIDTNWISSNGKYIHEFEQEFAKFIGVNYALSCSNGTVALHLALLAIGIKPGDEVIVPTLTFVATANAVMYCGATPVFVDSETETWNIDPHLIEQRITNKTKAIIVVHLYGHPANMDPIVELAKAYNLKIIEDVAEAHGATYKGRPVGSIGDVATFSFYGNKIMTTGEGGMVVTNDAAIGQMVQQLKGQGVSIDRKYWFPIIGYNYRMTNIQAAIGLAQLERINWHIERRIWLAAQYKLRLESIDEIYMQPEVVWAKHVYWMNTIIVKKRDPLYRQALIEFLDSAGIETRPVFIPMHKLPPYMALVNDQSFDVADLLSDCGFNIPSFATITIEEVDYICNTIKHFFNKT